MTPSSSSPAAGAVFLSYAREGADAARRMADALRAFGVEEWFDQLMAKLGITAEYKTTRKTLTRMQREQPRK